MAKRATLITRFRSGRVRADEELADHPAETVEHATEMHDAESIAAQGDSDVLALGEVVSALVRLDAGSYGICTMCDEAIPDRRLEAVPEAATCLRCANIKARGGRMRAHA